MTIAAKLQTLVDTKAAIKLSLENKGADLTTTPFTDYPAAIDDISTGSAVIGTIVDNKINQSEVGWLPCDGSFVSIVDYPELAEVLELAEISSFNFTTDVPTFNSMVNTISQDADYVYLGGSFTGRFAVVRKSDWTLVTGILTFSNTVNTISQDADYVCLGGSFTGRFAVVSRERILPAGFYPLPAIPPKTHNNITIPTQIQAEDI